MLTKRLAVAMDSMLLVRVTALCRFLHSARLPFAPHSKSISSPDNPHQADEQTSHAQRHDEDNDVLKCTKPFGPVQSEEQDEDEPHEKADHRSDDKPDRT